MNSDNDMSFPAWLWVILAGFLLVAGAVTFKMAQAYSTKDAATPAAQPAVVEESHHSTVRK
jgi:hypothetical protein